MSRRVDPNSPERCQASTQSGQCCLNVVEGSQYCDYHLRKSNVENKASLRAYLLTNLEIAGSAGRHSQVEELKSLREEIALARAMIEKRLNLIENNADFLSACGTVNTYLLTLERLITSCHRLEVNLGDLLSKAAILDLAKEIVGILMDELQTVSGYESIVDRISDRIVAAIVKQEQVE